MTAPQHHLDGSRWSLAIFSSRESASQLVEIVGAAAHADRGGATLTIDLLVNGNQRLAEEMRETLSSAGAWPSGTSVRLWAVPQPDKAETWNRYLHTLMPASDLAFFMDGYVTIEREALARMADAMRRRPHALAASCVPRVGPSAEALRRHFEREGGGFHGNLYVFAASTCSMLRATGFRLPAGIYRNDSALGAALAFNFEPARHPWRWDRIVLVPEARYSVPVAHPLRVADLKGLLRRRMRQAQGSLEKRALKAHLNRDRRPAWAWSSTARGLILDWAAAHPDEARTLLWEDPLAWLTLRRLRRAENNAPLQSDPVRFLGRYPTIPAQRVERPRSASMS
jgi:hypothetical protein